MMLSPEEFDLLDSMKIYMYSVSDKTGLHYVFYFGPDERTYIRDLTQEQAQGLIDLLKEVRKQ